MPKLLIKEGPGKGDAIELSSPESSIGRDAQNTICLADRTVSRFHARIIQEGATWLVSDLGSRNRTVLNGEAVQREELSHMDEIRLGNVVLVFFEDEATDMDALIQGREGEPEVTETISVEKLRQLKDMAASSREELSVAYRRLVSLLEFGQEAANARSIPTLFDLLTGTARQALEADRVVPILEGQEGALLPYIRSGGGFDEEVRDVGISTATVERCRTQGAAVLSHGSSVGPRKASGTTGIASIACAPLAMGEQLKGVIYCDRVRRRRRFTKEDLQYLCLLAAQTAVAIENIRSYERVEARARNLEREIEGQFHLVGSSPQMAEVLEFIRKAAPTDASVLICGESGTGKELVARAIHYNSRFRDGPFEAANCAAMNPNLIESELFGHVEGAFTGALSDRQGRFELAESGTIFLDEIGGLPLECQTKLLRVLEEQKIRRVGDVKDRAVNVRVVAATNHDLDAAMKRGEFRQDLFYRLDVLRTMLPPLRERGDDIEILAEHFLEEFCRRCGSPEKRFDPRVLTIFRYYSWPGNVRELKNIVERMVIMSEGDVLEPDILPEELRSVSPPHEETKKAEATVSAVEPKGADLPSLREMEKDYILEVLRRTGGNKKRAAEILGVDRTTLYARLKRHNLHP